MEIEMCKKFLFYFSRTFKYVVLYRKIKVKNTIILFQLISNQDKIKKVYICFFKQQILTTSNREHEAI